jgi:Zn-dependent peptidase ImmA (M78 family)
MRTLVLVIGMALAGCVSLSAQQQDKVAEIQRFADRTTALYGLPSVRITIQPATNLNIGAIYRQGNVLVNVQMLSSPSLTKMIAHELGHYVLGHYVLGHDGFVPNAASQAEWTRGQQQRELDANAKAVEILVRAGGLTEVEAVKVVADALRRSAEAQARHNLPLTPGHLPASAELADLLARFPASDVTLQSPTPIR